MSAIKHREICRRYTSLFRVKNLGKTLDTVSKCPQNSGERDTIMPARTPRQSASAAGIAIVLISPLESDWHSLARVYGRVHTQIEWFRTCSAGLEFLRTSAGAVVISTTELADGTWQDLLVALADFSPPPVVVVASRLGDETLWAEVLNIGGYDLLLTPFEPEETMRVIKGAWTAWQRHVESAPLAAGSAEK